MGELITFLFPQKLPLTDFYDAADCHLKNKTHPSCRAPLIPGPQVADNSLIIRGF